MHDMRVALTVAQKMRTAISTAVLSAASKVVVTQPTLEKDAGRPVSVAQTAVRK
jgi:hypothetical protein